MALDPTIARFNFESELGRARELAMRLGWGWSDDVDTLAVRVEYTALDNERYILVGTFDDYKEKPPLLDFEEPGTGVVGTAKAFPRSKVDSFFHETGPIICAPFSRKAYVKVHPGWQFKDWMTSTEQGVRWSQHSTVAAILQLIFDRLTTPDWYAGRMA